MISGGGAFEKDKPLAFRALFWNTRVGFIVGECLDAVFATCILQA